MGDDGARPATVDALRRRMADGRAAFEAALAALDGGRLDGVRDAAGWTALDHLAHLAAWERSMACLLRGRPRHAGLGVDEATYAGAGPDHADLNAAIVAAGRGRTVAEVLADWRAVRADLLAALAGLTDADLQRPYEHFLPDEPGPRSGRPVVGYLVGNTYEHEAEHLPWLRALAG